MKKLRSLRFRMMLLFCVTVGVLLAGSYGGFYLFLAREVYDQLDQKLLAASKPIVADLTVDRPAEGDNDIKDMNIPEEYVELLDPSGQPRQLSKNLHSRPLSINGADLDLSKPVFQSVNDGSRGRIRVLLTPFQRTGGTVVLVMARPTRENEHILQSFRSAILILLPVALLLTGVISGWYVGRSLAPVSELTRQAAKRAERVARSGEGEIWTPITVPDSPDELGRLAQTFNQLFERMGAVSHQLRQFVSDAAHELRTPLAVLQGETELVLSQPRAAAEYRKTLQIIDDELKKMSRIVQGLFTLSMADAHQLRLAKEPLYLDEVLEDACALATPSARAKNISIQRDLSREVSYFGDEPFLRQLFLIFLDNAIKYSSPDTNVRVSLQASNGDLRVAFEDEGIGIPAEHLPHIFRRFYRAAQLDAGESQSGGLGLAIAQAIVGAQGGSIECTSAPGVGSSFIIKLPVSPAKGPPPATLAEVSKG